MKIAPGRSFRWFSAMAARVRYRFFLLAGVFPYLLGAAVAYHEAGAIEWWLLVVGLVGILSLSAGIEGMNEYFDSKIGGDRVFARAGRLPAWWSLPVGLLGFGLTFLVALYLTRLRGWPLLGFALLGVTAALAYLMPPVRLSYRGLGEAVIAISYGPGLTLGSFYLQTGHLSWTCMQASLLPMLLILALSLANEVPDFYGDRLVGKRNLIVRVGRKKGVYLYGTTVVLCFALIAVGVFTGSFPRLLWFGLVLVPLALWNGLLAVRECQTPVRFVGVIRGTMLLYVLINTIAILGYVT